MKTCHFCRTVFKTIILLCLLSCNGQGNDDKEGQHFLEIQFQMLVFTAESGQQSITVSSDGEFTAQSSSSWCEVLVSQGSSDNLTIVVAANETGKERTAVINITNGVLNGTVTVRQDGVELFLTVDETDISVIELIGSKKIPEFTLFVASNFPLVFEYPDWISEKGVTIPVFGKKNPYSFIVESLQNKDIKSRTGQVVVKSETADIDKSVTISITQSALVGINYNNPVIRQSVPDPTVIQVGNVFYLYGTEDVRNMPIFRSSDMVNWTLIGTVFNNTSRPTFEPGGGLWAPEINYINGKYVLYYSMARAGYGWTCGIGRAVANHPEGPFTDMGKLFRSDEIGVEHSIDPTYLEDGGRKYLFWGSANGIWGVELTDDGLNLKDGFNGVKRQIAGTIYEAAYIHKRGNYYYLFVSSGTCCSGLQSTYVLIVGRSTNLWGPYTDRQGRSMMNNQHVQVLIKNSTFVGPGHCSQIIQDNAGNDWIFYHAWQVSNIEKQRQVMMDKIVWIDDWPTIAGGTPSIEAFGPVF